MAGCGGNNHAEQLQIKLKNKLHVLIAFSILFVSCKETISLQNLDSRYVKVEGIDVHYKVFGNGENKLVFIHGWGCDMNVWQKQFECFSANSQMVFIDLPGFGLSSKPRVNYSQNLFAKSVYGVLKELNISDPVLIGHSLGYPVSRQVVKNYPDLKPRLCIVDGVYFMIPKDSTERLKYMEQLDGFADLFTGDQRGQNINEFIKSLFIDSTPQDVIDYTNSTMKMVEEYVGHSTMQNLIKEEIWAEYTIDVPTIAVYANISELPEDNEYYLKKMHPNLDYQEVDNTGHFVMMEKPNEFNKILKEFVNE